MRTTLISVAFAALVAAAPHPQDLDFTVVDLAPDPVFVGPPVDVVDQTIPYVPAAAVASIVAEVTSTPTAIARRDEQESKKKERDEEHGLEMKRGTDDPCSPQPDGYGPKPATDSVDAFLSYQTFSDSANNAPTPQGYSLDFQNLQASVNAHGYLTLKTLNVYDTVACAHLCDATIGCNAFNLYFERDPTIAPAAACPNPASFTNIKCTLWGAGVTTAAATNKGQYRGPQDPSGQAFHVVITGSNGYTKNAPPPNFPGFDGPVELPGAINAPLDNGYDTYVGVKFTNGPYDVSVCAAACKAQTAYDQQHPATDGTYKPCNFFVAFVLSDNNVPQGLYCSMYTRSWDRKYATNVGQYRGSDYYSVSSAYAYTLSQQDPGHV